MHDDCFFEAWLHPTLPTLIVISYRSEVNRSLTWLKQTGNVKKFCILSISHRRWHRFEARRSCWIENKPETFWLKTRHVARTPYS